MKNIMKRIGLLSLIAILLASMLLLTACNDDKKDDDKETGDGTSVTTRDDGNTDSTPGSDAGTTTPNTSNQPDEPDEPTGPVYTVKVVDQNGNPVEGVKIQLCDKISGTCNPQRTRSDVNGLVVVTELPEGEYYASAVNGPDGYTIDSEAQSYFNAENYTEIVVTAAE